MEGDLGFTAVPWNGTAIHVFELSGEKHAFARAGEFALYGTATHSGSLNRALAKAGLPGPVLMRRAAPAPLTEHEYGCLVHMYTDFQRALEPGARPPKMISAVPLTSVEMVAHARRKRDLLEALGLEVPQEWILEDAQEALAKEGYVDLLVDESLDELRQMSLPDELVQFEHFADDPADEQQLSGYALQPSRHLQGQLDAYVQHKTRVFVFDRESGAVRDITAASDVQSTLRFLGYLASTEVRITDLRELRSLEPAQTQAFCHFLIESRKIKFGSVANYLNAISNILMYVSTLPPIDDADDPLDDRLDDRLDDVVQAVCNLRAQAERAAQEQRLYRPRKPGWISWADAKSARDAALAAMDACLKRRPSNRTKQLTAVSEALVISMLTVMPPDRCGVIRRLCMGETLKSADGGYYIDLTKFKHKTSRFYGPSMTPVSPRIAPLLDRWLAMTQSAFEFTDPDADANRTQRRYLFPQKRDPNRCLDSSGFTSFVKASFAKFTPNGEAPCPTLLRSAFITALREDSQDPELLQSAAVAQKHSIQMQGSDTYNLDVHVRATAKAMAWCESYADGSLAAQQPDEPGRGQASDPHREGSDAHAAQLGRQLDQLEQGGHQLDELEELEQGEHRLEELEQGEHLLEELEQGEHRLEELEQGEHRLEELERGSPEGDEWRIDLITGGTVAADGVVYHRILWEGFPNLTQWWQRLPEAAQVLASGDYESLAVHVCPKGSGPAVVVAVPHATLGHLSGGGRVLHTPDGSATSVLDMTNCRLDGQVTDWLLSSPTHRYITDAVLDGVLDPSVAAARAAWRKDNGKLFPSLPEAISVTMGLSPILMHAAKNDIERLQVLLGASPVQGWLEINMCAAAVRRSTLEGSFTHDCLTVLSSQGM